MNEVISKVFEAIGTGILVVLFVLCLLFIDDE